jgi:ubiquinone/menaquinone biosynthesis C-methylase UbiE
MTYATPSAGAFFSGTALVNAYDKGRLPYPEAALRYAARQIADDAAVLDMGAGNGRVLSGLFLTAPHLNTQFYAVDPSADMLASLKHKFDGLRNVDTRQGTFDAIPLPDHSIDTVICGASIHWGTTTPNQTRKTRSELSRILKPQGKLIVLSDDWATTSPLAKDLSQAHETILGVINDRGYKETKQALALRAQHHVHLALVKLRLTALSLKQKAAGLTHQETTTLARLFQERVGEIFMHENHLGGFFDHRHQSRIFRQSFDVDAQTLRDELHSHIWFDRMNAGQQEYAEDVLENIIGKHAVAGKHLTVERACLVVSGHLKK